MIRSAAESVLRELVAGRRFQELLTSCARRVEREALDRLRRRLEAVARGRHRRGARRLHAARPAPAAGGGESYHTVAKAIQERDRVINEAEADACAPCGGPRRRPTAC